ncbi:MAG TPA: hypothetical protein PK867_01625 [Pirellulales bacterium]|nr:hypothetical protein [Pirellulales bacterium]
MSQRVKAPPGNWSLQPEAIGAASQVLAKLRSLISATIQVERREKPGARVGKGKRLLARRSA